MDWTSGNWYFLNTEFGVIFVCSPLMQFCNIIVESFENKPKSLALDPTKGFMFYTKWEKSSLDRAHMDGSDSVVLVSSKIIYPLGITLDLANEHVYWVDTYTDIIERIDYDGQNRTPLKKHPDTAYLKLLHSIVVFENDIHVASWHNGTQNHLIIQLDRLDSKVSHPAVSGLAQPQGLLAFHRQRQPEVAHPCRERNGGCEHLCIPNYKRNVVTAQCLCAPGYRLSAKSCVLVHHKSFLIYAKKNPSMIKGIALSLPPRNQSDSTSNQQPQQQQSIVPILTNRPEPIRFDYNVKDQLIYFGQYETYVKTGD